jgi:hypothetical protein
MGRLLTQKEFIDRAKLIHGDKYDYSKVDYVNMITPVEIICPKHGSFWQTPNGHVNSKRNCPKCAHQSYPNKRDEVIEKFIKIYGDKYTYDKVVYKNNKTPIIVTCKKHGDFLIRPDNFSHGHGCMKCSIEKKPQCNPWTNEEFIERAKNIYGDKFLYDKVEYKNCNEKVIITCRKHGDFLVTPNNFLHGHSCPHCITSMMETHVKELLTENNIVFEQQKTFNWLKHNGSLKLDFYLPQMQIAIECQGLQHFKPVDAFGGEENFKITQERDAVKKELCEKKGIKLFYFSNIKDKTPFYVIKKDNELLKKIYDNETNNS